jgi:phosphinothricin acetyltransferase
MVVIDDLRHGDWPAASRIYAEGIATGQATFEEHPPSWED